MTGPTSGCTVPDGGGLHQGVAAATLSADFHIGADAGPLAVVPRELQLLVTPPIDNLISISHIVRVHS